MPHNASIQVGPDTKALRTQSFSDLVNELQVLQEALELAEADPSVFHRSGIDAADALRIMKSALELSSTRVSAAFFAEILLAANRDKVD